MEDRVKKIIFLITLAILIIIATTFIYNFARLYKVNQGKAEVIEVLDQFPIVDSTPVDTTTIDATVLMEDKL